MTKKINTIIECPKCNTKLDCKDIKKELIRKMEETLKEEKD